MKHYKIIKLAQDRQTFYAVVQIDTGYYMLGYYNLFEFSFIDNIKYVSYNEAEKQLIEKLIF